MQHPDDEDVSGYIAGLMMGTDDPPPMDVPLQAMTIRIPTTLAAQVIELSTSIHRSRNETVRLLLQAGLDAVLVRIPHEVADEFFVAVGERVQDMDNDD